MLGIFKRNYRPVAGHGKNQDAAGRLNARNSAHFLEIVAIELGARLFVTGVGRFKEESRQVIGIEAVLGTQQMRKAGDEQPGARGEQEAQSHLSYNQRGAQKLVTCNFASSPLF